MTSRKKDRIDYKEYHLHGVKVVKCDNENSTVMEGDEIFTEKILREEIKHTIGTYSLEDCVTEDEVNEGVVEVSRLGKEFRCLHAKLKLSLKDKHGEEFPDYEGFLKKNH